MLHRQPQRWSQVSISPPEQYPRNGAQLERSNLWVPRSASSALFIELWADYTMHTYPTNETAITDALLFHGHGTLAPPVVGSMVAPTEHFGDHIPIFGYAARSRSPDALPLAAPSGVARDSERTREPWRSTTADRRAAIPAGALLGGSPLAHELPERSSFSGALRARCKPLFRP